VTVYGMVLVLMVKITPIDNGGNEKNGFLISNILPSSLAHYHHCLVLIEF